MPRAQFDPSQVAAGIPVLSAGDYEFTIGEKKPFARVNDENKQVFGVMYQLVTTDEAGNTARIPHSLFMHNPESFPFVKRFLMSALGFDPTDRTSEAEFNAQYSDSIWVEADYEGAEPTVKEVGKVFEEVEGQKVAASARIVANKQSGDPQNQFNFKPVG